MLKWKIFTAVFVPTLNSFDDLQIQEFISQRNIVVEKLDSHFYSIGSKNFCAVSVVYSEVANVSPVNLESCKIADSTLSAKDQALYNALRKWRLLRAKGENKPAYTYLSNEQLLTVVKARPKSIEELRRISGIGSTKTQKYGSEIVNIVKQNTDVVLEKSPPCPTT